MVWLTRRRPSGPHVCGGISPAPAAPHSTAAACGPRSAGSRPSKAGAVSAPARGGSRRWSGGGPRTRLASCAMDADGGLGVAPSRAPGGRLRRAAVPLVLLLLAAVPSLAYLRMPIGAIDEGLLLLHPLAMADGRHPYEDFAMVYGPLGVDVLR